MNSSAVLTTFPLPSSARSRVLPACIALLATSSTYSTVEWCYRPPPSHFLLLDRVTTRTEHLLSVVQYVLSITTCFNIGCVSASIATFLKSKRCLRSSGGRVSFGQAAGKGLLGGLLGGVAAALAYPILGDLWFKALDVAIVEKRTEFVDTMVETVAFGGWLLGLGVWGWLVGKRIARKVAEYSEFVEQ